MAKTQQKTENENTEKAKAGTSLAARAKQLVLNLAISFKENAEALENAGIAFVETGELFEVANGFAATSARGLPLSVQLENTVAAMREILKNADTSNGMVEFTDEQEEQYNALAVKANRIKAAIKKEKESATQSAEQPAE